VRSTASSYDSTGNVTTETGGVGRTFTYDDENQLTAVGWGRGTYRTEFTYDGRGPMRRKVQKYYSGGQWTTYDTRHYVYDGMRVIQERNSSNVPAVAYTRGSDLSGSLEGAGGIGGLLARSDTYSRGSFTRHPGYHADGNGNVTALVDSAQALAASYRYNPYGGLLRSSGGLAGADVYRFSSKEWFQSPGLYYCGYRFYDPNLQRWHNRDPLGEKCGINLYRLVRNRPTDFVDPSGEITWRGGCGALAAVLGGALAVAG
jgi:RHS repeat-associated protein